MIPLAMLGNLKGPSAQPEHRIDNRSDGRSQTTENDRPRSNQKQGFAALRRHLLLPGHGAFARWTLRSGREVRTTKHQAGSGHLDHPYRLAAHNHA